MRLAYLDPHAVPDDIPEALQILYTVDALGQNGVQVELVTPPGRRKPEAILGRPMSERIHPRPVTAKPGFPGFRSNRPFYHAATRLLRDLKVDAVLVRNLKLAEHLLRRVPEIPLFFETHELFAQSFREEHPRMSFLKRRKLAALSRRENFVYRHAHGLIALTPLLIEDIRREYAIDTPAIVAPDGVDLEQAQPPSVPVKNQVPILLYLGSLHPWKGVDTLIRAIPYVTGPAILHIVGGNQKRIGELSSLAAELGVSQRVVFAGSVDPGRRFEWIHRADICLLPLTETSIASRYTSPLKLFEYMAAGKPVIVSDLPSMRAVLTQNKNALMVKPDDPHEWATAIGQLLESRALAEKLGRASINVANQYSWLSRAKLVASAICETLTVTC